MLTRHGCFGEYQKTTKLGVRGLRSSSGRCGAYTVRLRQVVVDQEVTGSQSRGINGARNHSWDNVGEKGELEYSEAIHWQSAVNEGGRRTRGSMNSSKGSTVVKFICIVRQI